jgi:hypothetical protein
MQRKQRQQIDESGWGFQEDEKRLQQAMQRKQKKQQTDESGWGLQEEDQRLKQLMQRKQKPQKRQVSAETVMDDNVLERICQKFIDIEDFQSLYSTILTNKRAHRVCQPMLTKFLQMKEKTNPRSISLLDEESVKPEFDPGDFDNFPTWQLGHQVEWSKYKNPNQIILWGLGKFIVKVPDCTEQIPEDPDTMPEHHIELDGPVTVRQCVDAINAFYKKCPIPLSDLLGDNSNPVGLNQDRKNKRVYFLDLE